MDNIYDYIKPNEFSFCPRCGKPETCRPGDVPQICVDCLPIDIKILNEREYQEYDLLKQVSEKVGKLYYDARKRLAQIRRNSGEKPKFWI